MADEEAERLQKALIEREMERKAEELRVLAEMRRDFTPRTSLSRTPPQGFSTPATEMLIDVSSPPAPTGPNANANAKRLLSSPEEVQEAVRRRIGGRKPPRLDVPPIGGLLSRPSVTPPPAPKEQEKEPEGEETEKESQNVLEPEILQGVDPLASAPVESLAGLATASTRGIMEAVRSKTSKLNKDEVAAIGLHTERIAAVIVHLTLRLAAAESRNGAVFSRNIIEGDQRAPPVPSYASALKLPQRQEPVRIRATPGPVLAFYPAEENGALKTAEETKAELKKAVDPAKLWVQVAKVRKVGNAGVLVQTTTDAAATRLRAAIPATLRVTEPKKKQPLVCLNRLDGDPAFEEVLGQLHEQNFKEDPAWPLTRIQKEATGAFKKNRSRGAAQATALIFACSAQLREALLTKGRVYIGWQAVEVMDYIDVTCCSKCQQYGHPERSCRSAEATCHRCGATGHRGEDCKSSTTCCATCKRFGRKEAASHKTAARDCPARMYAVERSVAMTHYA